MTKTSSVHPTAAVSSKAQLAPGVAIGAYSVVGAEVSIGTGTSIGSHVVIEGRTSIGRNCEIFHGACLGAKAQDKKYKEGARRLVIGDDNVIREFVTAHGSTSADKATLIGSRNFLMVGAHVGHDAVIGDGVVLANQVALGGHSVVEDGAVLGGMSGVHQFCRVGRLAMVGAMSKVVMDVAPFSVVDGHPAKFCGVNSVGLKRAGYSSSQTLDIKKALKNLLASGGKLSNSLARLKKEIRGNKDIEALILFCEQSTRGVCRGTLRQKNDVA